MLQEWYGGACKSGDAMKCFTTVAKKWEKTAQQAGDKVQDVQADLGMAKALFPAYVDHYRKSDAKKRWVEVEQVFDIPANENLPRLRGKVDGVFEYPKDKTLWALETKTASDINEETLSQALAFDFQCLFYLYTLGQKLGRPFSGVLYNIIRKPSIGRGDDKSSSDYVDKIREDIKKREDWYFARFELSFPQGVQARFLEELKIKLKDFREWWNGNLPTYKNESACRGKWNCEFLPVCAAGGNPETAGFKRTRKLFSELTEE